MLSSKACEIERNTESDPNSFANVEQDPVRATTVTKVKIRQVLSQFLTFLQLMTTLLECTVVLVVIATHDIINHASAYM